MPVGYVYTSFVSTSPAILFGGTWEQLDGVFLRAAKDTKTGGSDTRTLTTSNLPSHSHSFSTPSHTHSVTVPSHTHSFSGSASHKHTFTGTSVAAHNHSFSGSQSHSHNPALNDGTSSRFICMQNLTAVDNGNYGYPEIFESLSWNSASSVSGGFWAPYTNKNIDWGSTRYTTTSTVSISGTTGNAGSHTPAGTIGNTSVTISGTTESNTSSSSTSGSGGSSTGNTTNSAGSGTAFNNMPAYQDIYAWRRIA